MTKITGGISIRCDTEGQLKKARKWLGSINYGFRDCGVTVYTAPCRIYFHSGSETYDVLPYCENVYPFKHFYQLGMPKDSISLNEKKYSYEVVHCTTQEEWDFVRTITNSSLPSKYWDIHKENFCLNIIDDKYSRLDYYKQEKAKIYSFKEWCEKFGHKPDFNKPKFEVGKWYKYTASHISFSIYAKYSVIQSVPNRFYYDEYINDGTYVKKYNWSSLNCLPVLLTDLSEIQQYLPEGHPDKKSIEKWSVGSYVVFVVDYGGHPKGSFSKITRNEDNCVVVELVFEDKKQGCRLYKNTECEWFPTLKEAEEFAKTLVEPTEKYVECLTNCSGQFTQGKIYKVKEEIKNRYNFELDDEGRTTNDWGKKHFKPSTKEAYLHQEEKPGINAQKINVYLENLKTYPLTKEKIIEEAKKRFSIGTKFKDLVHNEVFTVSLDKFDSFGKDDYIYVHVEKNSRKNKTVRIYKNGVWAEIVETAKSTPSEVMSMMNEIAANVVPGNNGIENRTAIIGPSEYTTGIDLYRKKGYTSGDILISTHQLTNKKGKKFSPIKAELINVKKLKIKK